jgi:uncharacterized protein
MGAPAGVSINLAGPAVAADPVLVPAAGDRIASLDILRGLALLGMFVVHFHARSTEPGGLDDLLRTLIWRLVESKSHGTFALLFGAGFAIQLRTAESRNRPFTAIYLRRLAVLALFGVAAHAFFGFNVLFGYAVWGVPLLLIRKWSTRALVVTACLSAASVGLYHLAYQRYLSLHGGPQAIEAAYGAARAAATTVNGARQAAERQESFTTLLATRLAHMAWFYRQPFFFMPGATLALFITGLLLVRHHVFENPLAHARLLGFLAAFGIVSWLAANWVLERWGLEPLFLIFRDQWLTFTYVSAALLLLARWPPLISRLAPVVNAGRMALTNYLIQIAVLDVLFSGYAIGLGQIRPVAGFVLTLTCFSLEVVLSTVWLARFRFGPAEWLWRTLTYGRMPPLRRSVPDSGCPRPVA